MRTPNESAIRTIKDYISYIEEMGEWMGLGFKERSFHTWAANEIIKILERDIKKPPLDIITEFTSSMYKLSCLNKRTSYIFSIAVDTATEIGDLLVST